MNIEKSLTIFICSCDNYSDLWKPFFTLFNKYWPECKCDIILNTESKTFNCNGLHINTYSMFKEKRIPYGKRMIAHLKKVKTEYCFLLMDDYFLMDYVDVQMVDKILSYFTIDKKAACFNFYEQHDALNIKSSFFKEFLKRPRYGKYKHTFQAGIWRTKVLLKEWGRHMTAWEWEIEGNFKTLNRNYNYYTMSSDYKSPYIYRKDNYDLFGVIRGKWDPITIPSLFSREGIVVDYEKRGFFKKEDLLFLETSKRNNRNKLFRVLWAEYRYLYLLGVYDYILLFIKRIPFYIKKKHYVNITNYLETKRSKL